MRRQRLIVVGVDHRVPALLFLVVELHGVPAALRDAEHKPRAVLRFEHREREHGQVHGSVDAADVVPRAGCDDLLFLAPRVGRRLQEQPRQPLVAVAHRLAVDLEDVSKLNPAIAGRYAHEQHVRLEVAALRHRVGREPAHIELPGRRHLDLLVIGLLGDEADERALVLFDVIGGLVEELIDFGRLSRLSAQDAGGSDDSGEQTGQSHGMQADDRPPGTGGGQDRIQRMKSIIARRLCLAILVIAAAAIGPTIAAERTARLKKAGVEKIAFAWAGETERGKKHYYRIQGPTFLVEYDNTQNDGNHIHSVWRDFDGDFGRDLLREHVKSTPHP